MEERTARYHEIAEDVAAVAGENRRAAALLVAVAVLESSLSVDVDGPECAPSLIRRGFCDSGRAVSIWQLHGVHPETRREAAAIALRRIRGSMRTCRHLPVAEQLAAYARGNCEAISGRRLSRDRMALAEKLLARGE